MYKKKIPKKATIKIQQLQEQRRDSGNASLTVSSKKACQEGFSTWTRRWRPHQCLREKAEKQAVKRRRDDIVHAHSRTHTRTSCQQYTGCVALFQQPLQLGFTTSECSFLLFFGLLSLFFFPSSRFGASVVPPIFTVYKLHTCSGAAVSWRNGVGSKPSRETNAEEEKEEEGWRWRSERPMQSATSLAHRGPSACHG